MQELICRKCGKTTGAEITMIKIDTNTRFAKCIATTKWYISSEAPNDEDHVIVLYDIFGQGIEAKSGYYFNTGVVAGDDWEIDLDDCIAWCHIPKKCMELNIND